MLSRSARLFTHRLRSSSIGRHSASDLQLFLRFRKPGSAFSRVTCRAFSSSTKDAEYVESKPSGSQAPSQKPSESQSPSQKVTTDPSFTQPPVEVKSEQKKPSLEETGQRQKGQTITQAFQTETRQILDIVAKSLYTDKEVFLREIISNSSDALEKARYLQMTRKLVDPDRPFEIRIYTNEEKKTLTIQDFGVGMSAEDLVNNLGTIARSGSREFLKKLQDGEAKDMSVADIQNAIIGQFGVGFYSTFMVADKVEVFTQVAGENSDGSRPPAQYWSSDGSGLYSMGEAENVTRGTKIILHLKEASSEFSLPHVVEGVIKKYSNFVGFPIYLNDERVNTIEAIWTMSKDSVTDQQHKEFYQLIANAYDEPTFRMHFQTDSPININALLYFPTSHMEKFGMGRMDPGVSLYSRKVLIQPASKLLLPDWARFIKGVVDSEDIPLNISRENMQDNKLISRIRTVITKRVLRFLDEQMRTSPEKYDKWYAEFGQFLKEGATTDYTNKGDIAKLLKFDSSLGQPNQVTLDDYISRMKPDQKGIYYLQAPNRALAKESPYFAAFDKQNIEVLFLYQQIDHFLMENLQEYNKRRLISVEKAEAGEEKAGAEKKDKPSESPAVQDLCQWMEKLLGDRVLSVKPTQRMLTVPAIIVDHQAGALRKMLKYVDPAQYEQHMQAASKQKVEINPDHPIMKKLVEMKEQNPKLALAVVEQVFDNAMIAADVLDDPRSMLPRLNRLLENLLDSGKTAPPEKAAMPETAEKAEKPATPEK